MFGQSKPDSLVNSATTFELKMDTLYASSGTKFFVGQKLTIGYPSADGYRAIISNKAALVPSIWGQDKRYEHAIENYVASRKLREKLRQLLVPGNTLTIKRIVLSKSARPHFHMVTLTSDAGSCMADIKWALMLGELVLQ